MSLVFNPATGALVPASGSPNFKDPVTNVASLPLTGNKDGDVRYTKDTNNLYGWNGVAWVQLTISGGSSTKIEKFTLSAGDITNKYVVLSSVPVSAANTVLLVEGGPNQIYSVDYEITADDGGRRLSWNGLGLEPLLAAAEQLTIIYN